MPYSLDSKENNQTEHMPEYVRPPGSSCNGSYPEDELCDTPTVEEASHPLFDLEGENGNPRKLARAIAAHSGPGYAADLCAEFSYAFQHLNYEARAIEGCLYGYSLDEYQAVINALSSIKESTILGDLICGAVEKAKELQYKSDKKSLEDLYKSDRTSSEGTEND